MALSPELTSALLNATRESAAAFLDDLTYIRGILEKAVSPGEVRRLSAVLRRLLVERDLREIVAPRISRKIKINAPDNTYFYHAERNSGAQLLFFGTMPTQPFGTGLEYMYGLTAPTFARARRRLKKINPETARAMIGLPVDNFLKQRVICLRGKWVSRLQTIKYMANVGSGVHSSSPTTEDESLLMQISRSADYRFGENGLNMDLLPAGLHNLNPAYRYSPDKLNPVMVELLATARFLERSSDIIELEAVIRQELSHFEGSPHSGKNWGLDHLASKSQAK